MPSTEAIYAARIAYPQYLERGRQQVVALPVYTDGGLAAPSSGTYTLQGLSEEVVATGAIAVVGSIAQFTLEATDLPDTTLLGQGYVELWALVMPDGTTRTFRRDAVVVRRALYPVLTDADLDAVYSDLARMRASALSSWQTFRDEAWKRILGRLESQGNLPNLIMTPWSLREVHLDLTLYLIALDQRRGNAEKWAHLAEHHKREFELGWRRLNFKEADPNTDTARTDRQPAEGVVFGTVPPASSWGAW